MAALGAPLPEAATVTRAPAPVRVGRSSSAVRSTVCRRIEARPTLQSAVSGQEAVPRPPRPRPSAAGPGSRASPAIVGQRRAVSGSAAAGAAPDRRVGRCGERGRSRQPRQVKRSEIVFGSFGVEAGPLGTISGPAAPAIRAWVADVNSRGGLAGHPVRVILADDGGDPARAQAVVRQMVERDKVVAMFYPYAIGTLVPVLPYLEEKGIPVLGQMGAETLADYSAAVFQPFMAADKGTAWGFMLSLAAQTDKKKIGILWCREVSACSLVKDGVRKLSGYKGLEVVYDAQISFAQPDYTAEVLRAQQAGVEIMMTFADIATVNRVAQSSHRQNYHPVQSATHNMQHSEALNYADELDGLLTYSRIPPYNSPKMAPYMKAMRTYQPKAPIGELGGAAYVMGQLLEAKIAPLLDDDPTPAEITEAMYTLKNETLGGLLPADHVPPPEGPQHGQPVRDPRHLQGQEVPHPGRRDLHLRPGLETRRLTRPRRRGGRGGGWGSSSAMTAFRRS